MCRHEWIWLLPDSSEVKEEERTDYYVEKMLARVSDMVYCTKCKKTGHKIKSNRGGIRVHYYAEGYFVNKANAVRRKYNLPLLNIEQSVQGSVATDDEKSGEAGSIK